jgi:hypothetical protein
VNWAIRKLVNAKIVVFMPHSGGGDDNVRG